MLSQPCCVSMKSPPHSCMHWIGLKKPKFHGLGCQEYTIFLQTQPGHQKAAGWQKLCWKVWWLECSRMPRAEKVLWGVYLFSSNSISNKFQEKNVGWLKKSDMKWIFLSTSDTGGVELHLQRRGRFTSAPADFPEPKQGNGIFRIMGVSLRNSDKHPQLCQTKSTIL